MTLNLTEDERPPRIEMLPLIDVIFLLLVFFIYAIVNMQVVETVEVVLPQATITKQNVIDPIVIAIDKDNLIYLGKKMVTLGELPELLSSKIAMVKKPSVLVNGDSKADLGVVLKIVELFQQMELTNFAFRTETVEEVLEGELK